MIVRVTGVLVEDGKLLLLEQNAEDKRSWSLPGGKVEEGETMYGALVREIREETGLVIEPGELLYLCDNITEDKHVIHITFRIHRAGGQLGDVAVGLDTNIIKSVQMVPIDTLGQCGFTAKFQQLVQNNFPGKGSYPGAKAEIGL